MDQVLELMSSRWYVDVEVEIDVGIGVEIIVYDHPMQANVYQKQCFKGVFSMQNSYEIF